METSRAYESPSFPGYEKLLSLSVPLGTIHFQMGAAPSAATFLEGLILGGVLTVGVLTGIALADRWINRD